MHYEFPIEQLALSARTGFQTGFAKITVHLMPKFEDVILEPSAQGLKILGKSELALTPPAEVIRQIHADDVEIQGPRVRLLYGTTVREPVMWVHVRTSQKYAEAVVQDLITRDAAIDQVDWMPLQPVVLAKAPLRNLLGYPQALATLSWNTAELKMWLSHYAAVTSCPDDDDAA
jgi:hypothetical protein